MKKNELGHENIKQLLNHSVAQLERPTLARLRHAREQAMARYTSHACGPPLCCLRLFCSALQLIGIILQNPIQLTWISLF
jgi:hypothetical protein